MYKRQVAILGNRVRRKYFCVTRLQTGYTELTCSFPLQEQGQPVCTCGGARKVKHTTEDCSAFAELVQRNRMKGNLKKDLGNEQIAKDRTSSFIKAAVLLYYLHPDYFVFYTFPRLVSKYTVSENQTYNTPKILKLKK